MANVSVEADRFAETVEAILSKVGKSVEDRMPEVVSGGIKKGANAWRRNARILFDGHTYKKHGKTYETGAYSHSIRSHMLRKDGARPSGEVGSPSMPGLPHLLEFGHARVGGGKVNGRPHIEDAAKTAFEHATSLAEEMVDDALGDS